MTICKIDRIYKMLECIHNENICLMSSLGESHKIAEKAMNYHEDQWKLATGNKDGDKDETQRP